MKEIKKHLRRTTAAGVLLPFTQKKNQNQHAKGDLFDLKRTAWLSSGDTREAENGRSNLIMEGRTCRAVPQPRGVPEGGARDEGEPPKSRRRDKSSCAS